MTYFTLEVESEEELREASRKLQEKYHVTGEIHWRPLGGNRWHLEVGAEQDLPPSALEKLPGKLV
ncbi:MAG: hypothetical protein M0Z27_07815 [Thermaerobacter sp.]|jgi:hypothetical protein|nr:hypothetical protein [Thermaerobacter sp.]MDA8145950.1 hypothetical protein [Thermaerobacter sp.]